MASAFELLESYVAITERGADLVIAQMARVRAAVIAATEPATILVSTNTQALIADARSIDDAFEGISAGAREAGGDVDEILNSFAEIADNIDAANDGSRRFGGSMDAATRSAKVLRNIVIAIGAQVAALAALGSAAQFVSASFEEAFGQERSFVTFEALTRDAETALQLLEDLDALSQRTPFRFTELRGTAQQLLALGSSVENIVDEIRLISDVASGTGNELERISRVYTQVRSKQRLYAEEIQQFGDAGVPILQELAANLGVSTARVRELAEEGKLTFRDVEQAFRTLTSEAGAFANLNERLAATVPGTFSRVTDEITKLGASIASLSFGPLQRDLEVALDVMIQVNDQVDALIAKSREDAGDAGASFNFFEGLSLNPVRYSRFIRDIATLTAEAVLGYREIEEAAQGVEDANAQAVSAISARWRPFRGELRRITDTLEDFNTGTNPIEDLINQLTDPSIGAADALRRSVLTPLEELEDKYLEVRNLFNQGLIDEETFNRAISAALDDFDRLARKQRDFQQSLQRTAFEVGTTQAFEFRLQQTNEQRRQVALEEEQARLAAEANRVLIEIRDGIGEALSEPEVSEQTFESEVF